MSNKKTKKAKKIPKKTWEVLYTSDELRVIGGLLNHGDAHKIVEAVGADYHNVKRILSGNEGNGITEKATKGKKIVQEALKLINGYANELQGRIKEMENRQQTYLSVVNTMQRASA